MDRSDGGRMISDLWANPTLLVLCFVSTVATGCSDESEQTDLEAGPPTGDQRDGGSGHAGGDTSAGSDAGSVIVNDGGIPLSCGSHDDCPPGARCVPGEGVCRPACDNDFECGSSAECGPNGWCVPLERCGEDGACSNGKNCNCHGVCETTVGDACTMDLQCDADAYCDACGGQCKPKVEPCGRCSDRSSVCERHSDVCQPLGRAGWPYCLRGCAGQGNCDMLGPGYECRPIDANRSACLPRGGECSQPGDCNADSDCPDTHFCNERLFCQLGCVGDVECPTGMVCTNLHCHPACSVDDDCGSSGECRPDGHCRIPGGCVSSADCPEPETHCDLTSQMCAPGCERDNDCLDANKECVDGRCLERGCAGNYHCAFGEICELESGRCVEAQGRHCEAGCDPQDENACGGPPARCLSLQDDEDNEVGDFCFEACQPAPNECPQGYSCVDLQDQDGNVVGQQCVRRCDREPI